MKLFRPSYQKLSDEELMKLLGNGQSLAFDELYKRYSNILLHFFMKMLWRDREKSEDFVHDLFAKIIKKPDLFDTSRSFKTWLFSVANNMCKNEYKKQEVRKGTTNGLDHTFYVKDPFSDVLKDVHELNFKNDFQNAMHELDEKHKEVFALRHLQGLSIKEIAEVLNANEGTIKSRLFYATKYLASSLNQYQPIENQ